MRAIAIAKAIGAGFVGLAFWAAIGATHAQLPPRHPDEIELSSDPKCWTPKGHYKCTFRSVCKETWETEMYLRKYGSPSARIPRPLPRECREWL
jgi:hypothetical protein